MLSYQMNICILKGEKEWSVMSDDWIKQTQFKSDTRPCPVHPQRLHLDTWKSTMQSAVIHSEVMKAQEIRFDIAMSRSYFVY